MEEKARSSLLAPRNNSKSKSPYKQLATNSQIESKKSTISSPFKVIQSIKDIGMLNAEMEQHMGKLLTIFLYYSTYGDKLNITNLKSSKFHRLLVDAQIEDEENKKFFEILYSEVCKTGAMGFQKFLDALVKISTQIYPQTPLEDALISLVSDNLSKLYAGIEEEMKSSSLGKITEDEEIPHHVISLIMEIENVLYGIYMGYFKYESNLSLSYEDKLAQGLSASLKFIMDFEICPAMISRPAAFYIFQLIANKNTSQIDEYVKPNHLGGAAISFAKFVEYFIKIGVNSAIPIEAISIFDKLLKFLERLQLSKGFNDFEKQTGKLPTSKWQLLPSKESMEKV